MDALKMSPERRAAYLKALWITSVSEWPVPGEDRDLSPYGWCDYCSFFSYYDLVNGACPECIDRWTRNPAARPDSWICPRLQAGHESTAVQQPSRQHHQSASGDVGRRSHRAGGRRRESRGTGGAVMEVYDITIEPERYGSGIEAKHYGA